MCFITYFKAKEIGKIPISDDNKFSFYQKEIPLKEIYKLNKDYWILNGSFTLPEIPFISKRTNYFLNEYLTDEFNFLILDLDEVNNKLNLQNIVDTLKQENFHFSIWESSSHNEIDNFNLKGIIEFKGKNNTISKNKAINYINSLIGNFCKVDKSSIRPTAIQKPTHKEKLICYNEGNNILEFYFEETEIENNFETNNEFLNLCLKTYESLGYYICGEKDDLLSLANPKEKTKCGYFIYKNNPQICHHFNKAKTFTIYELIKNDPIFKKYNQAKLTEEFKSKLFVPVKNKIIFNQRYIDVENLNINIEENEVIYIKSPMGTGKTKIIDKLQKDKRVLLITNRITLAEEYKEKFPHFKLYNKEMYYRGDSLITQFESLHKYDLQNFDLFIIDEFMSLIDHSLSGLTEYKDINNIKLYYILKKLKEPLLIMDAFLTGFETNFINREKYKYYENTYRDNNNLYLYKDVNCFIESIENELKENKGKVTLSTTNKSFAKIVNRLFNVKYKVALITGDTENKEFYTQHFNKESHNEWDLLIYTPTITTGVNILNESKHHFHYSDGTGSVISSLQQIKRNRQADNIHFFLKGKRFNRIVDYNELISNIESKLKEFAMKNSLMVEFDEYANPKLNDVGLWHLRKMYLRNLLNTNPIFSFNILLEDQFTKSPIEIEKCINNYKLKDIKNEIKKEEEEKYREKINDLLNSENFEFQLKLDTDFKEVKERLDKYFYSLNDTEIKEIISFISNDKKFLDNIKYLKLFKMDINELKELIGFNLVENLNKNFLKKLELIYNFKKKNIKLKDKYTIIETRDKDFKRFISLLGYKKTKNVYRLKENILKVFNKVK